VKLTVLAGLSQLATPQIQGAEYAAVLGGVDECSTGSQCQG